MFEAILGDQKEIKMGRFLYEKSVSYQGYLIIPFVFGMVADQPLCSYQLLSDLGHQGRLHKAINPAGLYADEINSIIEIAKEHLDQTVKEASCIDRFQQRYTYHDHLIILYQATGKYFYDHYPPDKLNNIAAPKLFATDSECLQWVKAGLDQLHSSLTGKPTS